MAFALAISRNSGKSDFSKVPLKVSCFRSILFCIGFASNKRVARRMEIGFEVAAFRNHPRTVSVEIQLRLASSLIDQLLLALSQRIGFQLNRPQIRAQYSQKPMLSCPLCDHGVRLVSFFRYTNECCNPINRKQKGSSAREEPIIPG